MALTSLTCIHPMRCLSLPPPSLSLIPSVCVHILTSLILWWISLNHVEEESLTLWMWCFQAEILARYKPSLNSTLLVADLRQVQEMTAKALEYFKSTRHIVLYYEDVVKNRTVRNSTFLLFIARFVCRHPELYGWIRSMIHIPIGKRVMEAPFLLCAEISRCSRFSQGSAPGSEESPGQDTQGFFIKSSRKLGWDSKDAERNTIWELSSCRLSEIKR